MDVRLPDGTIVKNIPEGTTKAQLVQKLAKNGYDVSWYKPEQAASQDSGFNERNMRAELGRGLARGVTGMGQFIQGGIEKAFPPLGIVNDMTGNIGQDARQAFREAVSPAPANDWEKAAGTFGDIVGAMVAGGGLGGGGILRQAANVAVPAAGGAAGEYLGGEPGKIAGMLGPAALKLAAQGLVRAGVNPAKTAENIKQFEKAGSDYSLGQATDGFTWKTIESLLSRIPGANSVFRKFAERQQAQLGQVAKTGVDAQQAGRAIEKGISGPGGFIERSKAVWQKLDAKLANKISQDAAVVPENTINALNKLTQPVKGAEATGEALRTSKMFEVKTALTKDMAGTPGKSISILGENGKPIHTFNVGGTPGKSYLPYQALQQLRTRVGSMLDNALVSGVPNGELKALYRALSKDMESAAAKAGALQEFKKVNDFYSKRMDLIEGSLSKVLGNKREPEQIFELFMPKNPNQSTRVREVMKALGPEERKVVSEAVVQRLGMAKPATPGAEGVFSSNQFFTNWKRFSPEAKALLIRDPQLRSNLDNLASISEKIQKSSSVYANPSGSGELGIAAGGMLYLYHLFGPAGAAAGLGVSWGGAKLLTYKPFVNWMVDFAKTSEGQLGKSLVRLGVIQSQTADPQLKKGMAQFVNGINQVTQQQQGNQ